MTTTETRLITTCGYEKTRLDLGLGTDSEGSRVASVTLVEDGLQVELLRRHLGEDLAGKHLVRSVGEVVGLLRAANVEPERRAISDLFDLEKLRETMHLMPGNQRPHSEVLEADTGVDPNGPRDPYADLPADAA